MLIIVDQKKKRANADNQWTDPFDLEWSKREKEKTIEVPNDSDNVIHKFLREWHWPKLLIGKKVFCLNNHKEMMSGFIVDVIPPDYLLLKGKGVARFKDVISMEAT